jgi:hypothetical protein
VVVVGRDSAVRNRPAELKWQDLAIGEPLIAAPPRDDAGVHQAHQAGDRRDGHRRDKIEAVLAASTHAFCTAESGGAWKGHDWDTMDRLHRRE